MKLIVSRRIILAAAVAALSIQANAFYTPHPSVKARYSVVTSSLEMKKGAGGEDQEVTKSKNNKKWHSTIQKSTRNALVTGALLGITTFFGLPAVTLADDDAVMIDTNAVSTTSVSQTKANVRAGLSARRYWNIMASTEEGADALRVQANEGLLDYAVGTVNTMYYDNTGGARFTQQDFYNQWRKLRQESRLQQKDSSSYNKDAATPSLATRQGAVDNLKWIISTLNDPYSKYMTREELWQELNVRNDGFLGIGAFVEPPEQGDQFFARGSAPTLATVLPDDTTTTTTTATASSAVSNKINKKDSAPIFQNAASVQNLPVVTAVVPDSPAERTGITVGDRIVAVGEYSFLGQSREDVSRNFQSRFSTGTNYFGHSDITVAKPVIRTLLAAQSVVGEESVQMSSSSDTMPTSQEGSAMARDREVVIGYRHTRVRLPTKSMEEEEFAPAEAPPPPVDTRQYETYVAASRFSSLDGLGVGNVDPVSPPPTKGGNAIVHWELLTEGQSSIFERSMGTDNERQTTEPMKVGYIRLTRFSRASTAGYIDAVQALEEAGATSFIIDVRNNYGGVIQEAMLTASTLLRDPHAVITYTMNSRGGFTPHDVEEFLVDKRYPGYMLSKEAKWVSLRQAQRENPDYFDDDGSRWVPPSSYASLREQTAKRGLHRHAAAATYASTIDDTASPSWLHWNTAYTANNRNQQMSAQRNLVILVNEGTASAAEVFASALHDNGRSLALIGSKTFGKGLIQHTFPMPDGGGLRLTVAEYLTPALRHVTVVGNAKFDRFTGEQVGGGIKPDLMCGSKQGIPANVGADLCVGMALDVLKEAEPTPHSSQGQEKHHRQQKLKQRQEQDQLMKSGILALEEKNGKDGDRSVLTNKAASSSSVVAQEP